GRTTPCAARRHHGRRDNTARGKTTPCAGGTCAWRDGVRGRTVCVAACPYLQLFCDRALICKYFIFHAPRCKFPYFLCWYQKISNTNFQHWGEYPTIKNNVSY